MLVVSYNKEFYGVFYKKQTRSLCFITSIFPVNVHTLGLSVFSNTFPLRHVFSALSFYCVTFRAACASGPLWASSLCFFMVLIVFEFARFVHVGSRGFLISLCAPAEGGKALLFVHTIRKRMSCHLGTVVYRISDRTSTPNWLWI